jgi:molybdopterin converting factor small subunit
MATVILSSDLARAHTKGETTFEIEAATMRSLVRALEERFPGLGPALNDGMAVAIDGQIYHDFFLEEVGPDSEVCFLPAIEGG